VLVLFGYSVDNIVTHCGLGGPGIEVGTRFSAPIQTGPGVRPPSYTVGIGFFLGVKRPGRGFNHPPPSIEKKE